MRVHVCAVRMTLHRADVLEAYLNGQDNIQKATVYERTGDVVLTYRGSRKDAVALLAAYRFDNEELEVLVTSHDSRKINQEYQEKMVNLVAGRVFRKVFLPAPIAAAYTVWRSIAFVWKGIRCLLHRKLEVEVLDALSITASLLRGDYSTAGSVMFLLTVGSLLEEWTRKKSLDDLARSMALNVDKVWVRAEGGEVLVLGLRGGSLGRTMTFMTVAGAVAGPGLALRNDYVFADLGLRQPALGRFDLTVRRRPEAIDPFEYS